MTIDQLEATVAALQTRHRMDIEATREGENPPELDQVDRGDIEATREEETTPELDQVDRGDISVENSSSGLILRKKTGDKRALF